MRKLLLLCLLTACLTPTVVKAANAQAQEYDELGMALYRQGLYAKSIPYFQNATQTDPTDWQGYENLGNAYFKTSDNSDALNAYQKSLQINPDNSTLENIVQSLQNSAAPAANSDSANAEPAASSPNNSTVPNPPPTGAAPPTNSQSSVESEQPVDNNSQVAAPPQPGETIVVSRHRRAWGAYPQPITYADNLNPIDHAKFWAKFETGYTYSTQSDLINSASVVNNESSAGTLPLGLTSGNATMSTTGYNLGAEFGFLLNPYNGIAIGVRYIQSSNYNLSEINSAPASIGSNPNDFENAVFSPYVVPLTLDYYVFLPDHDGRFFISAGVGYYAAVVNVDESYNFDNFEGAHGYVGNPSGDLTAGTVGFQVSLGREFAVTPNFGLELFARGRYAKISGFQGVLSDGNNYGLVKFNDGSVDIDNPADVGSNGESYATIDFTGFDVGFSLNWYSF